MTEARSGRVVVGVGESLAALQALRYAVTEARRRGAVLRAVRVWQVNVPWLGYGADQGRVGAGADAESTIRRSFDRAMGGVPVSVEVELVTVEGLVGPALVAQAPHDNDLLILGAPGRHWWSASLFTVDRYCSTRASCPVVVVPAPALVRQRGAKALTRAIRREAQRLVEPGEST